MTNAGKNEVLTTRLVIQKYIDLLEPILGTLDKTSGAYNKIQEIQNQMKEDLKTADKSARRSAI